MHLRNGKGERVCSKTTAAQLESEENCNTWKGMQRNSMQSQLEIQEPAFHFEQNTDSIGKIPQSLVEPPIGSNSYHEGCSRKGQTLAGEAVDGEGKPTLMGVVS